MIYNYKLIYGSRTYVLENIEDDSDFTNAKLCMYMKHPVLDGNCDVNVLQNNGVEVTLEFIKKEGVNG